MWQVRLVLGCQVLQALPRRASRVGGSHLVDRLEDRGV